MYLALGIKLTKDHKILKFKHSDWLKNTLILIQAKGKMQVIFLKKLFFGKTMMNLRKRVSVKLVNNAKDYVKCKNFPAIHEIKPVLIINEPIYVGFSILDLSKLLMYEFHCKYINSNIDAKLLLTDTDSLVYEIKTKDVYDKNLFDFSDYPLDSVNKKVIGKMKDEFKGRITSEFIGLKSKMYSLISVDDEQVTKTKGAHKKIRHKEFVDVLFNKIVIRYNMKRIQSKLHKIGTYDVCKISFLVLMIKDIYIYIYIYIYILDSGVNSLAYFHKDIKD